MASMTNNEIFYTKKQVQGFLFDKSDRINTYTKTQANELFSEEQPVIRLDDFAISMTIGLIDAIDSKQNLLPTQDCITLQQVTTLETLLADLAPKTSVYTQGEIDDLLSDKNNTVVDDSLTISFIEGLADALTSKANQLTNIILNH